jgi:dethiobiotin synthetase
LSGRLVLVTGTGTEIGKTHFSDALLRAFTALGVRAAGLKPVESGVTEGADTDAARLARASAFHVKHPAYSFPQPVSPHLAARADGRTIDLDRVRDWVDTARGDADLTLVELAGGLFSPLTDELLNADLARRLQPEAILLVAPDRLGVLHDVVATSRAARAEGLVLKGTVLVTPAAPDASTGRNAPELPLLTGLPVLAVLPRAPAPDLARSPAIHDLASALSR